MLLRWSDWDLLEHGIEWGEMKRVPGLVPHPGLSHRTPIAAQAWAWSQC